MTGGQRFLQIVLPAFLFKALRSGTRNWLIVCPCGHKRDLWDAGGVKGEGTAESTYKKCPRCGERHWLKKRKKTAEELIEFPKEEPHAVVDGTRNFRPQCDAWAVVLVWSSALVFWVSGHAVWLMSVDQTEGLIALVLSIPAGFIAPWFWLTTEYRLTPTELQMQSGCFSTQLSYARIRRVRPRRGGIGFSYAFSLDTLEIKTLGARLGYRIAPEERADFMAIMAERCPHLRLRGEELIAFDESG